MPGDCPQSPGVTIHCELGRFSPRDLSRAGKLLDQFPGPRRLFVQWVPHGYGYRSVNIFFCLWLWMRAKLKRDQLQIMFHEVWLSFGINWRANFAAAAHRVMVALLKRAASKLWISCEAWREYFHGAKPPVGLLPVPSNTSGAADPHKAAHLHQRFCGEGNTTLIGHLGIGDVLVEDQLRQVIPGLLRQIKQSCFLLIGKAGIRLTQEIQMAHPDIAERLFASGILPVDEITSYICACDLMVQPYLDGISTRRTSAMAALANGRALLTTIGHSTEPFWLNCDQLAVVPAANSGALVARAQQLLDDNGDRSRMAAGGRRLYETWFDVQIAVQLLRGTQPSLNIDCMNALPEIQAH